MQRSWRVVKQWNLQDGYLTRFGCVLGLWVYSEAYPAECVGSADIYMNSLRQKMLLGKLTRMPSSHRKVPTDTERNCTIGRQFDNQPPQSVWTL